MKFLRTGLIASAMLLVSQANAGDSAAPKRTLKANSTEVFNVTPGSAENFAEMFEKGEFYGRLRFNSFKHIWGTQTAKNQDNWASAIGMSMLYKSAYLSGFGFTAGLYSSYNPWHMDAEDVGFAKAGKDVFSRYKVANGDGFEMLSLAQAYLEYRNEALSFKAGRQIVESFLTASNDTKMIPNTFEGAALESSFLPNTQFKAAFLTKEKLRDHETFSHLLAYGEDTLSDPHGSWDENDDGAMHKGLTLSKLRAAGINDRLVILEATNTSIKDLTVMLNYTAVPDLISSATIDAAYAFSLPGGMTLTPGLRYMHQMDDGAGTIGGANLAVNTVGYNDPSNLDGGLFGAKVELAQGIWMAGIGYTKVFDEGDLIAPWRGFPTAGYTRMMGQYNWNANTKTAAVYGGYDLGKAGLVEGLQTKVGYAIQNFDDAKPGVQADSNAFTIDLIKSYKSIPNLYAKIRMGFVNGDDDTVTTGGGIKADPSYTDLRFEVNYLF
ncbi:MAG: outer membrane porin, OprD family [Campylobacterales bacterium]|nr:outer membrane porin, OprD family [Campylobacterales bacterium]